MLEEKYYIDFGLCDSQERLRIDECFMKMSEVAMKDAYHTNIYNNDMKGHYGWIVSKQEFDLYDDIYFNETITYKTIPYKPSRVIFPRVYELYRDDKLIGVCRSVWTLLDLDKRSIVRPETVGIEVIGIDKKMKPVGLIKAPTELEYKEDYLVRYSDLDTNGHMNNARYMRTCINTIDYDYLMTHSIKHVLIHYKKEVNINEIVKIYTKKKDNTYYFEGIVNEDIVFLLEMTFTPVRK